MQTQVTKTNTTAAVSVFSHADIVRVLGLAAMMDAGLPRDVPGTTITVELGAAEADGEFTATVYGVIDHNYVKPTDASQNGGTSVGASDASLNSGSAQVAQQAPSSASTLQAPSAGSPAPLISGLQIPGAAPSAS